MSSFDDTLANLGVNRYTGATTGRGGVLNNTDTSRLGKTNMDQSDFLTLMTAQLKNQDPFAPVDNTQMVAQMAQFSSLSGISEMNTTLKAIASKLNGTSLNDALNYVGKTVLTAGSTAYPRTSGGIAGAVDLYDDATNVTVSITNAKGETLKTIEMGAEKKGAVAFDWDGKTENGEDAGEGPFTVKVTASNAKGMVKSQPLVWAPVQSVSMGTDGKPQLNVTGIGAIGLGDVWQIG